MTNTTCLICDAPAQLFSCRTCTEKLRDKEDEMTNDEPNDDRFTITGEFALLPMRIPDQRRDDRRGHALGRLSDGVEPRLPSTPARQDRGSLV